MKTYFIILTASFCVLSVFLYSPNAFSKTALSKNYTVVELYTSQGCSSCPPADRIFSSLVKHENIIALGFHVTYWDHAGWKDTLSREFSEVRQHGYSDMLKTRSIYTPQMIVNGKSELVGSRGPDVKNALIKAEKQFVTAMSLHKEKEKILVSLPEIENGSYRLWAFGYKKSWTQDINKGENRGKAVHYANAVLTYTNLGGWDGVAKDVAFSTDNSDIDGVAVLAQLNGYGPIIAAGKIEFISTD